MFKVRKGCGWPGFVSFSGRAGLEPPDRWTGAEDIIVAGACVSLGAVADVVLVGRTKERSDRVLSDVVIGSCYDIEGEIELVVDRVLLQKREEHGLSGEAVPGAVAVAIAVVDDRGDFLEVAFGENIMCIVVIVEGQAELLEVVFTADIASRFACSLDGGEKQCDESGDNRDDDKQLDKRKA